MHYSDDQSPQMFKVPMTVEQMLSVMKMPQEPFPYKVLTYFSPMAIIKDYMSYKARVINKKCQPFCHCVICKCVQRVKLLLHLVYV